MKFDIESGDEETIELSLEKWTKESNTVVLLGRRGKTKIKEVIMFFENGKFKRSSIINDGRNDNLKLLILDKEDKIIEI